MTITITGENEAPVATGSHSQCAGERPGNTVTASYTDADVGDTHSFSIDTTGTKGQVTDNGNGTFSYDPNGAFTSLKAGATATDTFHYTVTDGSNASSTATVTITITGENEAPVAQGLTANVQENGPAIRSLRPIPISMSATATASRSTRPAPKATVIDNGNGSFSYDPTGAFTSLKAGATATDTFHYTVTDGSGASSTATVTITITGQNEAPVANEYRSRCAGERSGDTGRGVVHRCRCRRQP